MKSTLDDATKSRHGPTSFPIWNALDPFVTAVLDSSSYIRTSFSPYSLCTSSFQCNMCDFFNLSFEVKSLIVAYLDNPWDVRAAYLTCKDFYDVIIPLMYQTLALRETIDRRKLSRLLSPDNPGLKHVRHICIQCPIEPVETESKQVNHVLNTLASHLPRDILLSVR